MPITGTTTDYTSRLLDINLSGKLQPLSNSIQNVTYSFGNPSQYIAGVQKLVQRYLISLMNSGFIEQILGRASSNISTMQSLFATYNWQVIKSFRAYQTANPSTQLDEQLDTVQLTNVAIGTTKDSLNFSLQLYTAAGTSVAFTLPIPL